MRENASDTHADDKKMVCCKAVECGQKGGKGIPVHKFPTDPVRKTVIVDLDTTLCIF